MHCISSVHIGPVIEGLVEEQHQEEQDPAPEETPVEQEQLELQQDLDATGTQLTQEPDSVDATEEGRHLSLAYFINSGKT